MTQLPAPITEFSQYMFVVKGRLPRTVEQYEIDLMLFFKYLKATRNGLPLGGEDFDNMTIYEGGTSNLTGTVTTGMKQVQDGFKDATGLDLMALLSGMLGGAIADKN